MEYAWSRFIFVGISIFLFSIFDSFEMIICVCALINLCILIEASKFHTRRITCTKSRFEHFFPVPSPPAAIAFDVVVDVASKRMTMMKEMVCRNFKERSLAPAHATSH